MLRIGNGFDVHQLVDNRKLIIGGLEIPFKQGLAGHSDADVLVHAIMDAMLGALALGDIGTHFPDTSPKFKNANSLILLEKVNQQLIDSSWEINNLDCIILAQAPKMKPYIPEMQSNIASVLQIEVNQISIKATTTEYLGMIGRGEGIAAQSIVLLHSI